MLDLMEQRPGASADPEPTTPLPTATYDAANKHIWATVIVSRVEGKTICQAPVLAIPISKDESELWTVTWTLVPGENATSATFNPEGIKLMNGMPDGVMIWQSGAVQDQPSQWRASLRNLVTGATSFKYNIDAVCDTQPFTHDPTIAVVTDPIDGCG